MNAVCFEESQRIAATLMPGCWSTALALKALLPLRFLCWFLYLLWKEISYAGLECCILDSEQAQEHMHTCDSSAAANFSAGTYLEREMLRACCNRQVTRSCRRRSIQAGGDCCMVLLRVSCRVVAHSCQTGEHHSTK